MVSLWVVNASPIILLAKAGLIDQLRHQGAPVVIPNAAATEVRRGGPLDPGSTALAQSPWLCEVAAGSIPPAVQSLQLGHGESAVLAHALSVPASGVIIDDRGARNAAASLGIPHRGTLGIIVAAKSQGLLAAARPVLEFLRGEGMYLSDQLLNRVLAQVGE